MEQVSSRQGLLGREGLRDYIGDRDRIKSAALFFGFVALCAVFAVSSEAFLTIQNIENIGRQSGVILIVGFGLTFVMIGRELDLTPGAVLAMTSMVVALLLRDGLPLGVALPLGLGVGLGVGAVNGLLTIGGLPSFLVTLAALSVVRGAALTITEGSSVPVTDPTFREYFGTLEIGPLPVITATALVIGVISHLVLSKTQFGRHVYAVGSNSAAARVAGVPVKRTVLITFLISGGFAAIAGILTTGRQLAATPTVAQGLELDAIAAVVLGGTKLTGGRGSIPGTLIGALMIAVISNGLTLLGFLSGPQMMLKGLIILIAIALDRWAERGNA